jgi:choline monooxygenase
MSKTTPQLSDEQLTPTQKASVRAPIEQAQTLPKQAFLSETFFAAEKERIFSRRWVALCFAQQVSEPGCLLPLEFMGIPLLLVHGDDGTIRVFHNITPYDGCLAVIDPIQKATEIITPYHGWHYNLQGKLQAIPYWDGSITGNIASLEGKPCDLLEIKAHTEFGVIWIDLSGTAGDATTAMAPLQTMLKEYRTQLAIGQNEQGKLLIDNENLATNWKTHYENWAINVLHEGFTHDIYEESPQIPRVNAQGEKTYQEYIDDGLMALSYREADFSETYDLEEEPYTHIGKDPAHPPERAYIGSFFPNLHFAVFANFVHMIIVHPVSPERTHTLRAQFYHPESAAHPDFAEERRELQAEFQQAGEEDGRITEAVQKARHSPVFEQHYYSPFWDHMHYTFSNLVLNTLEKTDRTTA